MKIQAKPLFGRAACPMAALVTTLTFGSAGDAGAQIRKEDNTDTLDLTSSWVGGVVPTDLDIAQWDDQLTFANSSDLGTDLSWMGIRILNPADVVTITGVNPNTLTLGASGIDMSAATRNLTIGSPLVLGSAQTWNITSGRALTIASPGVGAVSGTGPLSIQGRGRVVLGGLGATYTFTGGMSVSRGNGSSNVAGVPGGSALISAANLVFDLAANLPSSNSPPSFNTPALTVAGVTVHTIGGARTSGSGTPAWVQSSSLTVAAGSSNFTQSRGSSARTINQFSSISRAVGGTLNFRDPINTSDGSNNANTGGYRTPNSATVQINGIIPYITFTKSTAGSSTATTGTSFFASAGTGNNGTNYAAYTASVADSLGTATQNSTVSTDVLLSTTPAVVNSIRFNDPNSRTVTIDTGNTLTVGTGAILVTNNGTADQTITGGTLMGGNPGSGSGFDLIVHQHNNTSSLIIDSAIADNTVTVLVEEIPQEVVTPTALTKSGAGKLVLGGQNSYTGTTFVNSGTLLVNGGLNGSPSVIVDRVGTLGGTGTVTAPVTVNGTLAAGTSVGTLSTGELTFGNNSTLAVEIDSSAGTADKVNVTGGVATGGNRLNLTLTDLGGDVALANGTKFTIVDYSTTWPGTDLLTYGGATVANNASIVLGANTFIVSYDDAAVDGTALTLTVTGATATPFQTWITTFAAQLPDPADRALTADPDMDGRDNALEFALDGNPASAADNGKMSVSTEDSNDAGTDRDLSVTLAVRDGAVLGAGPDGSVTLTVDGLVYTIRAGLDLSAWTTPVNEVVPASPLVPAPNAGWTARTFQVTDSNGLPDKRFIQVSVSN